MFIVGHHFDTKCACSDLHALCSIPRCPPCTLDRVGSLVIGVFDVNIEQASKPTQTILRATSKKHLLVSYSYARAYRELAIYSILPSAIIVITWH